MSNSHKIISLGLGIQSTAMYYMSSMGELPRADVAVFSDTGAEKQATLDYLQFLLQWQKDNDGIPIVHLANRNLYQDLLRAPFEKVTSIPAYTENAVTGTQGRIRRQCTGDYKIDVIHKWIRYDLLGLQRGSKMPNVEMWMGISVDEIERMSQPQKLYFTYWYPFVGYQSTKKLVSKRPGRLANRQDLVVWYERNKLPKPVKSSCYFCPFHSQKEWAEISKTEDWKKAIEVDEAIRHAKGLNDTAYVHRSMVPLSELVFPDEAPSLLGEKDEHCGPFCAT